MKLSNKGIKNKTPFVAGLWLGLGQKQRKQPFWRSFGALSSTGSILSNTDLSDLSTVGTCDIFVYQLRHRVM